VDLSEIFTLANKSEKQCKKSETLEMKRNYVKKEERVKRSETEGVLFFLYLVDKAPSHRDV